jgi:DNA-binding transcriptional regulator YiaG
MNSEDFKYHCARLGWPPPFAAVQFGRSACTGYAWAAGTRKIPGAVASFMETYTDPITKPPTKQKQGRPASIITGAHLLAFRRHFALSQSQAAALAQVSRVTWNRWENAKSPIPTHLIHTLKAIVAQLKESKQ